MADLFGDAGMRRSATYASAETLRLTLSREWDAGKRVCFIGHNPSKASHLIEDPTTHRWNYFTKRWGYGSYTAVNLYPIRATDVCVARRWADWGNNGPDWAARDAIQANVNLVAREAKAADLVVACWGNLCEDDFYIEHVIEAVTSGEAPWPDIYCFGTTLSGAPKHPMARGKHRIADDAEPLLWRAANA